MRGRLQLVTRAAAVPRASAGSMARGRVGMLQCALARACSSAPSPKKLRFKDVLRPELVGALHKSNIFTPNAVQQEALPRVIDGEDVICLLYTSPSPRDS